MGGARDQRTTGGGVLQPQGVIPAGGVLLPSPSTPPQASASAGAFLMAALWPEWRSPLPADLEARIRDNTDDTRQEQAYYH
jgi:hypothetical protein